MQIVATLDLAEAAGRVWDAIVVGAGPAGALAACELGRRRLSVLLIDRASFPRSKVCGCCLNPWALSTLAAVGLGSLVERLGAVSLARIQLAAGGCRALVRLPGGRALSRQAFDAALVEAAIGAGAAFLPETAGRLGGVTSATRRVVIRRGGRDMVAEARLVLAADGLGGGFVSARGATRPFVEAGARLGAGAIADEAPAFYGAGTIFMACGTGGYVGLVRLEDGRLDVAAAFDAGLVKRTGGLGGAATIVLAEAGLPPLRNLADLPWRGTPLLTQRVPRPAAERVLMLGDAAGYVEPFTGEGIAWALACGAAVAPVAGRACRCWHPSVGTHWSVLYRRTVARRWWVCRALAGVLRRPALTRGLVAVLYRAPGLAAPVVRYLNAPAAGVT